MRLFWKNLVTRLRDRYVKLGDGSTNSHVRRVVSGGAYDGRKR